MGLTDCDDIAEGKKADLVVLDLHRPNMQPIHNIPKNIVYAGSKQNVKMTMINGTILYEDGKFFHGIDAEALNGQANEIIQRMIKQS